MHISNSSVLIGVLILSVILISSGAVDLDWQIVSYRYSQWHRTVDYWEYCPFIKINWWIAYIFNLLRLVVGTGLFGFCLNEIRHELK